MRNSMKQRAVLMIIVCALTGCASSKSVQSRLDSSGLTVVTLDEVIVLARPTRHLATVARDYVYLGPVEINRMGTLEHYVWVGMASTVDRALAVEPEPEAATLALLVDGVPMALSLLPWDKELDEPPYESSVPIYESFGARASLDQIKRIAQAESVEVHIITATGASVDYQKWQGQWSVWSGIRAPAEDPASLVAAE